MIAYIKILKFASDFHGITYENLFTFINRNNIRFQEEYKVTESSSQLINIFRQDFVKDNGDRPEMDYRGLVYLKTEALGYLLNYEALEQAKADAKAANKLAMWAICIAIVTLIITIYSVIY